MGSAYGLVGTVLVLTIWVYATCLVVFLGAEFCKVWTQQEYKSLRSYVNLGGFILLVLLARLPQTHQDQPARDTALLPRA